MRWAEHVARLG